MDERDYYWRLVNTPLYWQDAARELICAANLLKKDYNSTPRLGFARRGSLAPYARQRQSYTQARPIVVLYAFAVENLLKAILVASGDDPVTAKGELAGWFKTHNLAALAKRAGIVGLDDVFLEQLSAFIMAGKYPVGVEDGAAQPAHSYFPDTVLAGISKLLPQLEAELGKRPCQRPKHEPIDLLALCAGRRARAKRTRTDV